MHSSLKVVTSMAGMLLASAVAIAGGTAAAQAETVLRFATTLPEQVSIVKDFLAPWADKITKDSGGELRIEVVNGPTIANARNAYERVVSGVVDIAWGVHGGFPVAFPKTRVTALPLTGPGADTVGGSVALWNLYESGLLDSEYRDVKPLAIVYTPGAGMHSRSPVNSLDDLKGRKVAVSGREAGEIVSALGATPIAVTVPELYQTMSSGVAESLVTPYSGVVTFKLQEVTSDHLDVNLGGASGMIFMNKAAYAALSDKAKAAIDANSGLEASRDFGTWFASFGNEARDMISKLEGHTVHSLSDAETARWKALTDGWTQAWIKNTPDGQAVFDTFNAAYEKAKQGQ